MDGDLEISVCSVIYNFNLLLFGISFNNNLSLINKYGDINDNKILLALCYVNQNHFKVLYENIDKIYNTNDYIINEKNILKNINKISDNKNLIFKYLDCKRNYSYEDIYNYLKSKYNNDDKIIYPYYINKINSKKKEKQQKTFLKNC